VLFQNDIDGATSTQCQMDPGRSDMGSK